MLLLAVMGVGAVAVALVCLFKQQLEILCEQQVESVEEHSV